MAPPVTYQIDGVQYVSVLAGWGGPDGLGNDPSWGPVKPGYGRILTFTLGGNAAFKPPAFGHKDPPPMPSITRECFAAGRASGRTAVRRQLRGLPWRQGGGRPAARSALCQHADAGRNRGHCPGRQRARRAACRPSRRSSMPDRCGRSRPISSRAPVKEPMRQGNASSKARNASRRRHSRSGTCRAGNLTTIQTNGHKSLDRRQPGE